MKQNLLLRHYNRSLFVNMIYIVHNTADANVLQLDNVVMVAHSSVLNRMMISLGNYTEI